MTEKLTKAEGAAKIKELVKQAQASITEAEEIANATGNEFSFNVAYGMGGWYYPDRARISEWEGEEDDYEDVRGEDNWGEPLEGGGWISSSSSC